jgi:3-oxoacyl-[acyl-carrier protein] reductase
MTQTILVTGGNRGIGRAIAEAFVANGDRVFITSRTNQTVPGCQTIVADLTEPGAADRVFDEIEGTGCKVDAVVANAGMSKEILLIRMTDQDISDLVATNLTANIQLCRRAAKSLMKQRSGSIIIIGSVLGMSGSTGSSVYAATKSALIGLTRSLAREIGSRSITVNLVAPGYVNTEMTKKLPQEFKDQVVSQTPLQRIADPEEIGQVVLFLSSNKARFITGAIIPVDGGLGMGN